MTTDSDGASSDEVLSKYNSAELRENVMEGDDEDNARLSSRARRHLQPK